MALAIDGSTPAVFTTSSQNTVTSASFTPPAGSIVVVAFAGNTNSSANPAAPTITDSLATDLTYTRRVWRSHADGSPAVAGHCAIWTAPVVTSAAMTITVTTSGTGTVEKACRIWVVTGQHASPIGATGGAGSASTSAIAQNYTSGGTGGQAFGTVIDWDDLGSMTAGSGCTLDGTGQVGSGQISYAFPRRTSADGVNGVTNTLRCNPNGTSTNLQWAWVEILPAAGGSSTSRDVADGLTAADAVTRTSARPRAVADTLTAADAVTRAGALPRAVADTLTGADTPSKTIAKGQTPADGLGAADTPTRLVAAARGVADGLGAADTPTRGALGFARGVADALAAADTPTRGALGYARGVADGLGAEDTSTLSTLEFLRDTTGTDVVLADTADISAFTTPRDLADVLTGADTATATVAAARDVGDDLGLADEPDWIAGQVRAVGDTLAAGDAATRAGLVYDRAVGDTLAAGDAATRAGLVYGRATGDALAAADTPTAATAATRSRSEGLGLQDTPHIAPAARVRPVADTLTLADIAAPTSAQTGSTDDTLTFADQADWVAGTSRQVTDTAGLADTATRAATTGRVDGAALTAADQPVAGQNSARGLADGLAANDNAGWVLAPGRLIADTLTLAGAATGRVLVLSRGVADHLGMADVAVSDAAVAEPPIYAAPHSITFTSTPARITATVQPSGVRRTV